MQANGGPVCFHRIAVSRELAEFDALLVGGFGTDLDGEARTHRFVAGVHGWLSLKERAFEDGIRRLRPGTTIREAGEAGDADEPTERDQENQGPEDAYVMPGHGSLLSGHQALLPVTRSVDDGRRASHWTLVSIAARRRWTSPSRNVTLVVMIAFRWVQTRS